MCRITIWTNNKITYLFRHSILLIKDEMARKGNETCRGGYGKNMGVAGVS